MVKAVVSAEPGVTSSRPVAVNLNEVKRAEGSGDAGSVSNQDEIGATSHVETSDEIKQWINGL